MPVPYRELPASLWGLKTVLFRGLSRWFLLPTPSHIQLLLHRPNCWPLEGGRRHGLVTWSEQCSLVPGLVRLWASAWEAQNASRRPCIWLARANEQARKRQWLPKEQMCLKSASVHLVTSWNRWKIYIAIIDFFLIYSFSSLEKTWRYSYRLKSTVTLERVASSLRVFANHNFDFLELYR